MVLQVVAHVAILLTISLRLIQSQSQEYGPRCLHCSGVASVTECKETTECWPHEICFAEKILNGTGSEWFNFGCKTREECNVLDDLSPGKSRRFDIELRTCQQCCNQSLCNAHLCQTNMDFLPCFSCTGITVPETCAGVALCPADEECYAEKYLYHGLHPQYNLGCAPQLICDAISAGQERDNNGRSNKRETTGDYSATYLCQRCCTEQGCNAGICNELQSTTPAESTTVNSSSVTPSENVTTATPETNGTTPIDANVTTPVTNATSPTTTPFPTGRDCWELRDIYNVTDDGEYLLQHPSTNGTISAWCDMTTDGGGWIVFQRRVFGNVSFDKNWTVFEDGFGELNGAFWWGNKNIHEFTQDEAMVMRIDLHDVDGDTLFAEYGNFSLSNSSDYYRLLLGGFRGSAGKLMYYFQRPDETGSRHAGQQFSTKDVDRDNWAGNCAIYTGGGFWLNECCIACLNGKYKQINENLCMGSVIGDTILHCVQQTELKFRPASAPSNIQDEFVDPPP